MNIDLSVSEEKNVQPLCPSSIDILCENLAAHKRTGKKTKRCTKRNIVENVLHYVEIEEASNMDKRTKKGFRFLRTIKKKWTYDEPLMRKTNNR